MEKPGLFLNGTWRLGEGRDEIEVLDPATEEKLAALPAANRADLDEALESAERAFAVWASRSAFDRARILRAAAALIRNRCDSIARVLSAEQGKPLAEANAEVANGADITEWFADEGRRAYGRIIPARVPGVTQQVVREPVGPVAAFSPWNFPVSQAIRKIAASLAAGCTIIIKGPEEAPSAVCEIVRCFDEAGVDKGALNLVFGRPAEISGYLIPAGEIRKVSFTGSIPVGKQLAAMAGSHMKPVTMELGGHAPVIVFDDTDAAQAATALATFKYRNAGQVCISPTRFFVHEKAYEPFLETFVGKAKAVRVGRGLDEGTQMGPLATQRRVEAISDFVAEAVNDGASLQAGGQRLGNAGYFYAPTVLADVPENSRIMNEEPFGPVALINRFSNENEAIELANRTPYGLAGYAFTRSARRAALVASAVRVGMMSINHFGLGPVETPFGGVNDSGFGREGGSEGLDAYLVTKLISHLTTH